MSIISNNSDSLSHRLRMWLSRYWGLIVLLISMVTTGWYYLFSNYKLEQLLESREWQSVTETQSLINDITLPTDITHAEQSSHMVYLPDHHYSRITTMRLHNQAQQTLVIRMSEVGVWHISGRYLLTEPTEFKEMTEGNKDNFSPQSLKEIKTVYKLDAQQGRKLDIVNDHTLLLTNLNYGSTVLYSL